MKPSAPSRLLAFLLLAAVAVLSPGVVLAQAAPSSRPNILFIMSDDQAPWALGVSGHPHAKTPNMDRIAKEGAYLKNAFCVTPVCSPSRASLMTSRYGSELGITDWIHPKNEPKLGLSTDTVTWPELLQQAGYKTGLVGKWHLGLEPSQHPTKHGYGYFMGFTAGGTAAKDPTLEKDGKNKKFSGFTYDVITDDALEFIRNNKGQPFALSLHYRAPHTPYMPQPETDSAPFANLDPQIPNPDYPKLDVKRVKKMTNEYLGSVAGVDRNVGRVLDLLDELKIADNTLVIFTSDHGYSMGHNGMWHKGNGHWILTEPPAATPNIPKNQRPNMFDNSLKVPCVVRWPGKIKPGTTVERSVTHLDWLPTLLAAAGVEQPKDLKVYGRNALPVMQGETPSGWDDDVFAQYSTHHQSKTQMRAYRTPKWKLMRDFLNPGRDELYDLQADPAESNNLIESTDPAVQQVKSELNAKLLERMKKLNDPALKSK